LWLLRVVSHATELDADREACRLAERAAPQVSGIPATRREAAAQLAAALDSLTAGAPRARRRTWLHPSIADRLDALLRIA
jgi:Zn-dependent protease with chaperone function